MGMGSIGLNEYAINPKFERVTLVKKNRKKQPLNARNTILGLNSTSLFFSDNLYLKNVKIISANEKTWLREPKKPKLINVKQMNKL